MRIPESKQRYNLEEAVTYNELTQTTDNNFVDYCFALSALYMGIVKGKVLDIGTGPGWIPIRIAQFNPGLEIYAIDISLEMLEIARQNTIKNNVSEKIKFLQGEALTLPFYDDFFDLIICHSVFHHISNPTDALNEINRVLKDDGGFLIRDLIKPVESLIPLYINAFGKHYSNEMKNQYYDSLQASYTLKEVKKFLKKSDIKDAHITQQFITHWSIYRESQKKEKINIKYSPDSLFHRIMKNLYIIKSQ